MNERIRNQFANSNPFDFKHIYALKSIENFNDVSPSVVMASRVVFRLDCQDNHMKYGAMIRKMHVFYLGMSWKERWKKPSSMNPRKLL